jgi:hypothetical protein
LEIHLLERAYERARLAALAATAELNSLASAKAATPVQRALARAKYRAIKTHQLDLRDQLNSLEDRGAD